MFYTVETKDGSWFVVLFFAVGLDKYFVGRIFTLRRYSPKTRMRGLRLNTDPFYMEEIARWKADESVQKVTGPEPPGLVWELAKATLAYPAHPEYAPFQASARALQKLILALGWRLDEQVHEGDADEETQPPCV